jgi:hypothetical protein
MFEKFPNLGSILILVVIVGVPLAVVAVSGEDARVKTPAKPKYPDEHLYIG